MKLSTAYSIAFAAGASAFPRMFEDGAAAYQQDALAEAEMQAYFDSFANAERLHYRAIAPMIEPMPARDFASGPSPPPASLPVAMPTGPWDPKAFMPAKTNNSRPQLYATTPFGAMGPEPTHPLAMPPPGPPMPVQTIDPLSPMPKTPKEWSQWLDSIYFGNFEQLPGAAWQNAGLGPRAAYVSSEDHTGHLPVMPMPTTTGLEQAGRVTTLAVLDGTKTTSSVDAKATVEMSMPMKDVVSEPVNPNTLDIVTTVLMTMVVAGKQTITDMAVIPVKTMQTVVRVLADTTLEEMSTGTKAPPIVEESSLLKGPPVITSATVI